MRNHRETDRDEREWLVKLPDGRVRAMTLDELDAAYQCDRIGLQTELLEDGASEWTTLGALVGVDTTSPTVPLAPQPAVRSQPAAFGGVANPFAGGASAANPFPAPPTNRAAGHPVTYGPREALSGGQPSLSSREWSGTVEANSMAPVARTDDADWEFGPSPFKKKRNRAVYAVGALVVGAGVVLIANVSSSPPTPERSVAAVTAKPAAPSPPPAPLPVATPQQPTVTATPPAADARLNADTKRAAVEADKKQQKTESRKQGKGRKGKPGR